MLKSTLTLLMSGLLSAQLLAVTIGPAHAEKLTCTRIAKQCVKECSKQVAREFCQRYCSDKRNECLVSGRWDDMERSFTNVRKK